MKESLLHTSLGRESRPWPVPRFSTHFSLLRPASARLLLLTSVLTSEGSQPNWELLLWGQGGKGEVYILWSSPQNTRSYTLWVKALSIQATNVNSWECREVSSRGKRCAFELPRPHLGATELLAPLRSSFHTDRGLLAHGREQGKEGGHTAAPLPPPREARAGWARLPPVSSWEVAPFKPGRKISKGLGHCWWWAGLPVRCGEQNRRSYQASITGLSRSNTKSFDYPT